MITKRAVVEIMGLAFLKVLWDKDYKEGRELGKTESKRWLDFDWEIKVWIPSECFHGWKDFGLLNESVSPPPPHSSLKHPPVLFLGSAVPRNKICWEIRNSCYHI